MYISLIILSCLCLNSIYAMKSSKKCPTAQINDKEAMKDLVELIIDVHKGSNVFTPNFKMIFFDQDKPMSSEEWINSLKQNGPTRVNFNNSTAFSKGNLRCYHIQSIDSKSKHSIMLKSLRQVDGFWKYTDGMDNVEQLGNSYHYDEEAGTSSGGASSSAKSI
ncbi:unnamed protein product [Caenorhabditis angaria]|uniref:Uncharacterized protein n=1 Tax=Caenorhabditis angaria TaxID=860376 RepID=A0A9P1MZY0_9PELO|nr:unnamed protein product [Caenorhabditis angaria]